MSSSAAATANVLADAAFGGSPNRWPLPPAAGPREVWLRAVAAGAQGRYASAAADLDHLLRSPRSGVTSLALSTRASFLRQLGWHERARHWDGRAVAEARDDEALGDALVGLAADALGVGRFAASARALHRAAGHVAASGSARLPVRMAWVSAELAMFRGDGAEAVRHAEQAVTLAADHPSVRHAVKSQVVLAAALCSVGDLVAARREADAALSRAGNLGLVPLRWAAACLLADTGGDQQIVDIRDTAAQAVTRWGGVWRPR